MSNQISEGARAISELNNPFTMKGITAFSTFCRDDKWNGWQYRGTIEFQAGATEGKQSFTAGSFASLLNKMEAFMSELEAAQ